MAKEYTPFKMKGFSGFGNSPAKHTSSAEGHMKTYGKGHTNDAHPDLWDDRKIEKEIEKEKAKRKAENTGWENLIDLESLKEKGKSYAQKLLKRYEERDDKPRKKTRNKKTKNKEWWETLPGNRGNTKLKKFIKGTKLYKKIKKL